MKDLITLSDNELQEFFNSFDQILTDVDGVLSNILERIPGTDSAIKSLKKIGKKITAVSNNTTKSLEAFEQQFKFSGIDLGRDEIVTPSQVMISYLHSRNFSKEIFVLSMPPLVESLESAGFKIAEIESERTITTLHEFATVTSPENGNIGAVISDVDLNLNYTKLQTAASLLKRPDVIFLTGAMDVQVPIGLDKIIIGPGCFHKILEQITGRKGMEMCKPSSFMNDFLVKKCGITDPKRVLFIGDSVPIDMGFATKGEYQKLLVLSGLTKREEVENWSFPEELKPDFYVDSLKDIHDLILRAFGKKDFSV